VQAGKVSAWAEFGLQENTRNPPQPSPPTHGSQSADSHVKAKERTEKNSKVHFGTERDFEPRLAGTAQLVFLKFICKTTTKVVKIYGTDFVLPND
jgi:hypothetical protein